MGPWGLTKLLFELQWQAAGDNSPSDSAAASQSEDARANDSEMEEEPLPADQSKKVEPDSACNVP